MFNEALFAEGATKEPPESVASLIPTMIRKLYTSTWGEAAPDFEEEHYTKMEGI